ncbi:MAG: glycosyltransferase family 39 protein [Deltaproteobacteria bacterium]|nr:glycosyltransferase family 39 protein [Deltaproteobacteria bacterium]
MSHERDDSASEIADTTEPSGELASAQSSPEPAAEVPLALSDPATGGGSPEPEPESPQEPPSETAEEVPSVESVETVETVETVGKGAAKSRWPAFAWGERVIPDLRDHGLGFLLCAVYVLLLIWTAKSLGYARDEGFYFDAARSYARWFDVLSSNWREAITRQSVDAFWQANHEHPALMKSLFALSWKYLYVKHHVFAEAGTAMRFPGMVMGGAMLWLAYIMGSRAYSRRAGLFAALALALMPRYFYHAHLDCFDVPVMFWWTLVVYCYWRSIEGSMLWAVLTGIAWGCALNVKFNCFMLPVVFLIHWFVVRGRHVGSSAKLGGFSAPVAVLSMLTLGVVTFVALWPWMWFDFLSAEGGRPGRLGEYLSFHWNHPYYNMEFFGHNYFRPPFPRSFPYVMIAYTVPAITLVLFTVGLISRVPALLRQSAALAWFVPPVGALRALHQQHVRRDGDDPLGLDVLFLGAGYAILALWLKTNTPIFGGTKHWFTAYPFLCLFAGAGFEYFVRASEKTLRVRMPRVSKWWPAWLLVLLPAAVQTQHSHPFGLTAYTPLAGGTPGSADRGMNRQFWGFTTGSLVSFFNERVPPNGSVFIHDTAWPSWEMMQSDRRLRPDIRVVWEVGPADFAIVHHELHMMEVDGQIWTAFGQARLAHVVTHDGVPIVSVYENPRLRGESRQP